MSSQSRSLPGAAVAVALTVIVGAAPPQDATDLYLDRSVTGAEWCYNPDSKLLSTIFTAPPEKPDDLLSGPALADDVHLLARVMRENYVGWGLLAQLPGFDVEAFFRDWERQVRDKPSIRLDEGVRKPFLELRNIAQDQHLGMPRLTLDLAYREYQAEVPDTLDVSSCRVPVGAALDSTTVRTSPLVHGTGELKRVLTVSGPAGPESVTLQCAGAPISLKPRIGTKPRDASDAPLYSFRSRGDVGIVEIRRFYGPPAKAAVLQKLVTDYPRHRKQKLLIFDLRSNSGGDDGYVYDWVARATAGRPQSAPSLSLHGPLYECREWNAEVSRQAAYKTLDTDASRARRAGLQKNWPYVSAPTYLTADGGAFESEKADRFSGELVVLLDRASFSAAETSAYILRTNLSAVLIGERSAGMLEFMNVNLFALPRTRLIWGIPTDRAFYGQPVERVGLPVDAYLEDGEITLSAEQLIPAIRKVLNARRSSRSTIRGATRSD